MVRREMADRSSVGKRFVLSAGTEPARTDCSGMEPRLVIAYGLIVLLVLVMAGIVRMSLRKRKERRRILRGYRRSR